MSEPNTHRSGIATQQSAHSPLSAPAPPQSPDINQRSAKHKKQRSWLWITTVVALTLLLASAVGISIYLYRTTQAWQERSVELSQRIEDMADEKATIEEDLAAVSQVLERTETQLDTARDRITELADEKAQLGDEHAVQQRLVEYQEHVAEITEDVLFVLEECIGGQEKIIGYLGTPDRYDPDDLERIEEEISDYCVDATDLADELKKELSQ